ncbi:MAG: 6-phosphogluconolactonase, partial [Pyrinomonadaceae bacterium]
AEMFTGIAREAIAERGRFDVALSGGSTPRMTYEMLASEEYSSRVDWPLVHFFWSDERCVAPDNEQSNYLLAAEAMLNHLPIEPEQIHRMHGEDESAQAAAAYEAELRTHFGSDEPRFDLIYLGMGDDGHTASLFPGSPAVDDLDHLVSAPFVEKFQTHRLTMTLLTINAAAQVIFLTAGAAKTNVLREVLRDGDSGAAPLPARLVRPANGDLLWLVDEAAAAKL